MEIIHAAWLMGLLGGARENSDCERGLGRAVCTHVREVVVTSKKGLTSVLGDSGTAWLLASCLWNPVSCWWSLPRSHSIQATSCHLHFTFPPTALLPHISQVLPVVVLQAWYVLNCAPVSGCFPWNQSVENSGYNEIKDLIRWTVLSSCALWLRASQFTSQGFFPQGVEIESVRSLTSIW